MILIEEFSRRSPKNSAKIADEFSLRFSRGFHPREFLFSRVASIENVNVRVDGTDRMISRLQVFVARCGTRRSLIKRPAAGRGIIQRTIPPWRERDFGRRQCASIAFHRILCLERASRRVATQTKRKRGNPAGSRHWNAVGCLESRL